MLSKSETICIIGGGWSASSVDLSRLPGLVIGVNESSILARCDIALSMDRLWTEHRWPELEKRAGEAYIRRSALKNVPLDREWLHPFECDYKSAVLSEALPILNGTNSGLCAFNLAYLMRPVRIFLIGFDMNRSPEGAAYWYPPYPWTKPEGATTVGKYQEWARQFEGAAKLCAKAGILVDVVNPRSALRAFRRISFAEFKELSQ